MTKTSSAQAILKDLENLYTYAIEKGNLAVALKAKELLGRGHGLFGSLNSKKKLCLQDLSEEDIEGLIKELEAEQLKES